MDQLRCPKPRSPCVPFFPASARPRADRSPARARGLGIALAAGPALKASLTAKIDGSGQLTGTVSLIARNGLGDCTSPNKEIGSVTYKPPGGTDQPISIPSLGPGHQRLHAGLRHHDRHVQRQRRGVRPTASSRSRWPPAPGRRHPEHRAQHDHRRGHGQEQSAGLTHQTPGDHQPAGARHLHARRVLLRSAGHEDRVGQRADVHAAAERRQRRDLDLRHDGAGDQPRRRHQQRPGLHPVLHDVGPDRRPLLRLQGPITDDLGQYTERDLLLTASNNAPPVFDSRRRLASWRSTPTRPRR